MDSKATTVLISIHPKYVDLISAGKKKIAAVSFLDGRRSGLPALGTCLPGCRTDCLWHRDHVAACQAP